MDIDFTKVNTNLIAVGVDNANMESIGYLMTDRFLCEYHAATILKHMENVMPDLTETQQQKVLAMYNNLIVDK